VAVTSQRLISHVVLAASPTITTLYVVPAGRTLICRAIVLHNKSAATVTGYVYGPGINVNHRFLQYSLAAGESRIYDQVTIWNPGDNLSAIASAATAITATLMGSLLQGAPV